MYGKSTPVFSQRDLCHRTSNVCTPVVNNVDHGVIYSFPPEFCKEVTQGCEMQLVL